MILSEPELAAGLDEFAGASDVKAWLTLGGDHGRWRGLEDAVGAADPVEAAVAVDGDDVHRLMYTSGTTSRPKGVMITHAHVHWKCEGQVAELGIGPEDRGLACGPLYHVGALDLTTTNMLHAGASTHILRRFEPATVLAAIERERSTNLWLAPAMVNLLLESGEAGGRDLSSVRVIVDGGEKMPLPLIERVLEMFPRAWFADAYGLTETVSGDTFLDKGHTLDKLGSVGTPIPNVEVGVVDADDGPVAAGETGEIVIRGAKVCKGYWRDADATAAAIRDGWFHTGDLGYLDEDGYLFVVDRLKDMIISGGENVASLEVERALYEHPDVVEAAVVGSAHPRWGEVPVAYVVVREGARFESEALNRFCRERLAGYKAPKGFRSIEALPRNPSGKVLKRELREREAAAHPFADEP
jgi:acyl-CoA synthetase (AMP-forming)/AMP-acid ligase II